MTNMRSVSNRLPVYFNLIHITLILLVVVLTKHNVNARVQKSIRDRIVEHLFADYRNDTMPGEMTQSQTRVTVNIAISAITSVDVRNMEYNIDMLLRQAWNDPRLAWDKRDEFANYTRNIVSPVFKEKIWIPDLFFRNGKKGRLHSMTCENLLIRIQPNGDVLFSQKITMIMICQMQLSNFPMDTQECHLNIGSYAYTFKQLAFVWHSEVNVTLPSNLQISEFDPPKEVRCFDCTATYSTSTGIYSCLQANFTLSRQLGYWFASTYLPNVLIMVVSWLNFWVSLDAIPARVNLSLLTLLGVITQASSTASILPRVSYIKAIDVWTIACIAFNSGVLLEFAVASHVARKRKAAAWHHEVRRLVRAELAKWCSVCQQDYSLRGPTAAQAYAVPDLAIENPGGAAQYIASTVVAAEALQTDGSPPMNQLRMTASGQANLGWRSAGQPSRAADQGSQGGADGPQTEALLPEAKLRKGAAQVSKIDLYSRVLFPLGFLVFNACYWVHYMVLKKRSL